MIIFKGGGCVATHHAHGALGIMGRSSYRAPLGVPPPDGGLEKKPDKPGKWKRFIGWLNRMAPGGREKAQERRKWDQ
jgi:hypothetical protein